MQKRKLKKIYTLINWVGWSFGIVQMMKVVCYKCLFDKLEKNKSVKKTVQELNILFSSLI